MVAKLNRQELKGTPYWGQYGWTLSLEKPLDVLEGRIFLVDDLVTTSELGRNGTLDSTLVKEITGGDPITCRFLYREMFSYLPKYKLIMAVNQSLVLPKFSADRRYIFLV